MVAMKSERGCRKVPRRPALAQVVAILITIALVAGCARSAGGSGAPGTSMPGSAGASSALAPTCSPSGTERPSPPDEGQASAAPISFITGWPTVARDGVALTGREEEETVEGLPYSAPALTVRVTIRGLDPGAEVSISGSAAYSSTVLGCGLRPDPCEFGSGTTDPSVHICRPEFGGPVEGTVTLSAILGADERGEAATTFRFVIPESARPCPAGPDRPWYVGSGHWRIEVTDEEHGLRLESRVAFGP